MPVSPDSQPVDIVGMFRSQVSSELLEHLVLAIRDESRKSKELAARLYSPDQAQEAAPQLRRAGLGTALLTFEEKIPNVKVSSIKSSGSSYYIQIETGDITILCARARTPKVMLPEAVYRTRIATSSIQHWLFEDEPPPVGARVYGVVLYGGPSTQVDPQFIVVRFPIREHRAYLDDSINLKSEYAYIFGDSGSDQITTSVGLFNPAVELIEDATTNLTIRKHSVTGTSETP